MLALWIYLATLTSHADRPPLSEDARAQVEAFRAAELTHAPHTGHESVVRVHHNAADEPVRTKRTALIISGLFDSPRNMRRLEEFFFAHGENVVNLRLAAHWEVDVKGLAETVSWRDWRAQSIEAFALAKDLGDKVTLVGHSTGGLLGTWLAIDNPADVAALVLFAPAFALNKRLRFLLAMKTERTVWVPDPRRLFDPWRVITLHAGREVERLGIEFQDHLRGLKLPTLEDAADRLAPIPVWMANTGFERIIDLATAEAFGDALARSTETERRRERIHVCNLLLHNRLAGGRHRHWTKLMRSLGRTLGYD